MKTRRRNYSEDPPTICRRNTRPRISSSKTASENSEPIPTDLIIEILTRLPAKSIARCRCVSKKWTSMLRRPDFTELYLTRSRGRPQLLFACQQQGQQEGNVFFFSAPHAQNLNENASLVTATYHMKLPFVGLGVVSGSIHGLVCFTQYELGRWEILPMICNPGTGQFFALPHTKTKSTVLFGLFGFDPIDKQFKVLIKTPPSNEIVWTGEKQVLMLGAKKLSLGIVAFPINHIPMCRRICIDGVLYYVALLTGNMSWTARIVGFDVRSSKFRFFGSGSNEQAPFFIGSILVKHNGKLAALVTEGSARFTVCGITRKTRSFEMFVLEDPTKDEWSKHVYEFPPMWQSIAPDTELYFVGVAGTNEFVLSPRYISDPFNLFYYNIESKTIRRVEIQGMEVYKDCKVDVSVDHVEDVNLMETF